MRYGAEGETRTRTKNSSLDPEPSASTSSATSAQSDHKMIDLMDKLFYLYRFIFLVNTNCLLKSSERYIDYIE